MTEVIKVQGLREFSRKLKAMDSNFPKELRKGLNTVADAVIDEAVKTVPHRTGRARRTLKAKSTRTLVRAAGGGTKAPYYPWLDFGGRVGRKQSVHREFKKRGRYLYPAYDKLKANGTFERKLSDVIKQVASGAGVEVD